MNRYRAWTLASLLAAITAPSWAAAEELTSPTSRSTNTSQPSEGPSPFQIRGALPWHNFLSGPSAWNEDDYRAYLDDLASRKLNFVGFHCYTGGAERYAPYVEPMIRLQYRDVIPEAGFDTSLTARWGYRPLRVKDFAFGTDRLFTLPAGAEAFGATCAVTAHTNEERYRKAHDLMRKALNMAHARGLQMAMGFEFGVHPPELASIVPPESRIGGAFLPDPTHPANIEILQSAVQDILTEYPGIDYIWLWLHEHSMFIGKPQLSGRFGAMMRQDGPAFAEAKNEHDVFTGVWSLVHIRQVHEVLSRRSPKTRLVIGGWGGGPQLPPVLRGLDRALPADITFSCLNPGMGSEGHAAVLTDIARRRPVWSIPWLEGDAWLWHLQLRASSVMDQVKAAHADRLAGVIGIHWRTEEVRPTLEAFALTAADPLRAPSATEFYRQYSTVQYGPDAAEELARLLIRFERGNGLGFLASPEFYPYDPTWGRMGQPLFTELREAIGLIARAKQRTASPRHQSNLDWLADNLRFALLLDEVGRGIEPAYRLKEAWLRGAISGADLAREAKTVGQTFKTAPIEQLFRTYARRVRSRGELGELSALNQKLWLQYRELDRFLSKATATHSELEGGKVAP